MEARRRRLGPERFCKLKRSDVKTTFLHGELEEDIYMDQPEGFIVPGKVLICV